MAASGTVAADWQRREPWTLPPSLSSPAGLRVKSTEPPSPNARSIGVPANRRAIRHVAQPFLPAYTLRPCC
jgi:hypothetical protein